MGSASLVSKSHPLSGTLDGLKLRMLWFTPSDKHDYTLGREVSLTPLEITKLFFDHNETK